MEIRSLNALTSTCYSIFYKLRGFVLMNYLYGVRCKLIGVVIVVVGFVYLFLPLRS